MPVTTAALVPAAGRGQRFGSAENKIWAEIDGRTVLWWSTAAFHNHEAIDAVIVIAESAEIKRAEAALSGLGKVKTVVAGGASRQESVLNGLRAASDFDLVLVHDAARPLVSSGLISNVLFGAAHYGAAIPGVPVGDTLKRRNASGNVAETIPRNDLWAVQTPQGFRRELLETAYERLGSKAFDLSDEAGILEVAGIEVRMVQGESDNIKITHPEDLARAERILQSRNPEPTREFRTGFGYDVHAFAEGRELWLGGIRIPHSRGLLGHSDADVLLHAVCDALLGAAGLGDIGRLFPDTESTHKDRPSVEFLREVSDKLRVAGWRVVNVDVSLLAEEPRIGAYVDQISALIADATQTARTQINIKATTSEGLGFVGRREGIACWAVATLGRL